MRLIGGKGIWDGVLITGAIVVACLPATATAQIGDVELAGYVTMVGGQGEAVRVSLDTASPIPAQYAFDKNMIAPGEAARTGPASTAVVFVPRYEAVVYLEASSELRLDKPAVAGAGVDLVLVLVTGRASVVRRGDNDRWLIVAGEAEKADAAGYVLSRGASLVVEARRDGVTFAARRGDALVFTGRVPAAVLIDERGTPTNRTGVLLLEGRRLSMLAPQQPAPDAEADAVVPVGLPEDLRSCAMAQSYGWLRDAERGDFVPVRGGARTPPGMLGAEFEPAMAFDQPRPATAAPSPRAVTSAVRATLSPAQTLVQSGVPGTVIAGQRFRRSRIIGSPATAGTGALTVNRAAELLVRLGRD